MRDKKKDEWKYLMQPPKLDLANLILIITTIGLCILGIIKLGEVVF